MAQASWPRMLPALAGLGLFYLVTQFARNALGVISGDIEKELSLRATETALLAGAMFLAYGLCQLPAAALLSRFGPRRVLPPCGLLLCGSLWGFAAAESFPGLLSARVLMGAAAAPVITGAYAAFGAFGDERFSLLAGLETAFGRAGVVVATTPLALLVAAIGWRGAFGWAAIAAAVTGAGATLVLLFMAGPPDEAKPPARAVLPRLLASPSFRAAVLFQGMASASGSTILGLWGGPWLSNVYGLDVSARGGMLLAMALAWFASAPAWSRVAGMRSSRTVVLGAAGVSVLLLAAAAAIHLPVAMLLPWLALLGAATGFYPALLVELRRDLPPGTIVWLSTLLTAGTMLIVFAVQFGSGLLADLFPGSPGFHPEAVYQAIFAALAALLALSATAYHRAKP